MLAGQKHSKKIGWGTSTLNVYLEVEYGAFPHFEETVLEDDGEFITRIDYRGITKKDRKVGESIPEWIDHPVKTDEDWHLYKETRLTGGIQERLHRLPYYLNKISEVDAPVQVGEFPWGPFGTLRDLIGAEGCLLAFYDMPETVHDIINTYADLWIELYQAIAEKTQIDIIHLWEDMSGRQGSLISMEMVEEFMMPAYDRIIKFAAENRVKVVSVDTDGLCDELVASMTGHGINAFMPFEVQAGNDIEVFREQYPSLGIYGGLDKRALAAGKREIGAQLDKAERMFAKGGYIAGFDHAIPSDVPWENYRYAVTELQKMAGDV